jgi:hypothetical protein
MELRLSRPGLFHSHQKESGGSRQIKIARAVRRWSWCMIDSMAMADWRHERVAGWVVDKNPEQNRGFKEPDRSC